MSSISIESPKQLFAVENDFLIDIVHHKLMCNSSNSSNITIPSDIEMLGLDCFSNCESFSSISFESNSQLTRIESVVFLYLSLKSILIPTNVQILGFSYFQVCPSRSSISFEYPFQLKRIESLAFHLLNIEILFIASDAVLNPFQIALEHCNSCPEVNRWPQLRAKGISVDNLRGAYFKICDGVFKRMYQGCDDECLIVVEFVNLSDSVNNQEVEREIEKEVNLWHHCSNRFYFSVRVICVAGIEDCGSVFGGMFVVRSHFG
jgi:hypothetical protein